MLLDESYTYAKEFFDLPEEIKTQYARPEIGGARGYTPFGKETALGENVADLKEFWHLALKSTRILIQEYMKIST